jgi:hypothetical protein
MQEVHENRAQTGSDKRAFSERLRDPQSTKSAVERVRQLDKALENLVRVAESDLVSFYSLRTGQFVRLAADAQLSPSGGTASNAGAVIALEAEPRTQGDWKAHRAQLLARLADMDRHSEGLPFNNVFTSSLIGVALQGPYAGTLGQDESAARWPETLLKNIERYRGVAVESLGAEARPHPYATYWAVRALLAYHYAIRAEWVNLDECLRQALGYCAETLYRLHTGESDADLDVVAYAFAVATLWHRPLWLEAPMGMDDGLHLDRVLGQALGRIMRAQRETGLWRSGNPLYVRSPRAHVYVFPVDLLYGLFERVPERLRRKAIEPDQVLDNGTLTALERFVEWSHRERFPAVHPFGPVEEAVLPRGWASSSETGAQRPECWATAIVLRAAKAALVALRTAANQAARSFLPKRPESGTPWRQLALNGRVRQFLAEYVDSDGADPTRNKPASFSAILAGPPGTGKTTVAGSIDVSAPLIYVAPNYLAGSGPDHLPAKLDQTFEVLRLLERGVVLFDEIDEVVLEREGIAQESFSRLLTTSMLPRFQKLKDEERVTFLVATNHVEKFDVAIRREGRFDAVVAIEYPDRYARCQLLLAAIGTRLCAHAALRQALLENEAEFTCSLLGPITKGQGPAPWQEALVELALYGRDEDWLCDAFADLYMETMACAKRASRLRRPVEAIVSEVRRMEQPSGAGAIERINVATDELESAQLRFKALLRIAWCGGTALLMASKSRSQSAWCNDLRKLLESWRTLVTPTPTTAIGSFELFYRAGWCERVLSDYIRTCMDRSACATTDLGASKTERLVRSLARHLTLIDNELGILKLPGNAPHTGHALETASTLRAIVAELASSVSHGAHATPTPEWLATPGSFRQLRDRFQHSRQQDTPETSQLTELVQATDEILAKLPQERLAPFDQHVPSLLSSVRAFFKLDVVQAARQIRDASTRWQVAACELADLIEANANRQDVDRTCDWATALRRAAAEVQTGLAAWWSLLQALNWLVRQPSDQIREFPGYLVCCENADRIEYSLGRPLNPQEDNGWRTCLELLRNGSPDVRARVLAEHAAWLKIITPDGPVAFIKRAWRFSDLHRILGAIIADEMSQCWRETDQVPVRTVPWGLPFSDRPLHVAQHLTFNDLQRAADMIDRDLGLDSAQGLKAFYARLRAGDLTHIEAEIRLVVRQSLAKAATDSRFYQDAFNYHWRLSALPDFRSANTELHSRWQMPRLTSQVRELLNEYPVLWALRADMENDAALLETCRLAEG